MKNSVTRYAIMVFGVMLTAFAISTLYVPNKIVSGGVSGISTILYHTLHIPASVSFGVINLALLLLAWKILGIPFVKRTMAGAVLLTIGVELFSYLPPLTNDLFLATLFGAILYGFGIGLTLVVGATTGGTDILSRLLQHFFPHIQIGKLLLAVDSLVIFSSLLVFRTIDLALFGIVALMVSTFAIDWLIQNLNISKLAFVMTDQGVAIARSLVGSSHRGVTIVDVTGAYTMEHKQMLVCALKANEVPSFQKKVLDVDPTAFVVFSESQQIVGNGFRVYR